MSETTNVREAARRLLDSAKASDAGLVVDREAFEMLSAAARPRLPEEALREAIDAILRDGLREPASYQDRDDGYVLIHRDRFMQLHAALHTVRRRTGAEREAVGPTLHARLDILISEFERAVQERREGRHAVFLALLLDAIASDHAAEPAHKGGS